MTNLITLAHADERPIRQASWLVLLGAGIMYFILQFGVTFLVSIMDLTRSWLIGTAVMLVFVLAFGRCVFARRPVKALSALAGTIIALLASFPLACLFERASFSIWPTVILHVATHTFRLMGIPEPYSMTVLVARLVLQIGMPFLIWAFRGTLLKGSMDE